MLFRDDRKVEAAYVCREVIAMVAKSIDASMMSDIADAYYILGEKAVVGVVKLTDSFQAGLRFMEAIILV